MSEFVLHTVRDVKTIQELIDALPAEEVPPDEIWFISNGRVVGKIINIQTKEGGNDE